MKIVGFIPARMKSSRFPGKPLASICGKPMIEHVYKRSAMSSSLDALYIATCDNEIIKAAQAFGGETVMTSSSHTRCTDRVAEAYRNINCDADILVIIQGDEPLVHPDMINLAVTPLLGDKGPDIFCVNLVAKIKEQIEFEDPNEVKVVFDKNMRALYFSREPIPSIKNTPHKNWWKQVCIMPFWEDSLNAFSRMDETPLEILESVDMMRVLENGYTIQLVESPFDTYSVDTEADRKKVEQFMANDPLYKKYK
jgi:3-deoxy-manno-octulosonate cytidylyltransferase (CMP-KDO synthetase)